MQKLTSEKQHECVAEAFFFPMSFLSTIVTFREAHFESAS